VQLNRDTSIPGPCFEVNLISKIDIWRAAQLMLKRYGDQALKGERCSSHAL
jgi:hypothetical protein